MPATPSRRTFLGAAAASLTWPAWATADPATPGLSPFDFLTQREQFCRRITAPDLAGDEPAAWLPIRELTKTFKATLTQALDAPRVAGIVNGMIPLSDRLLPKYDALIADCAATLRVPKPRAAAIDEDRIAPGNPHIYLVELSDENVLVISSKLLRLYADAQDELRFLVGRELTRGKCGLLRYSRIGFAVSSLLALVRPAVWPAEATETLCPLLSGYFLTWCREAELSADRGGFYCCPDRATAERSLLRLHCGLDQATVAKYGGTFDPDAIIRGLEAWEQRPFVAFLRKLQGMALACPYVDERVAALRVWEADGGPARLRARAKDAGPTQNFTIASIRLTNLAEEGKTDDVYLRVYAGDTLAFKTLTAKKVRDATWEGFDAPFACPAGQPVWVEAYSASSFLASWDSLLGLAVVYPQSGAAGAEIKLTGNLDWSAYERRTWTRQGVAEVRGRYTPA